MGICVYKWVLSVKRGQETLQWFHESSERDFKGELWGKEQSRSGTKVERILGTEGTSGEWKQGNEGREEEMIYQK